MCHIGLSFSDDEREQIPVDKSFFKKKATVPSPNWMTLYKLSHNQLRQIRRSAGGYFYSVARMLTGHFRRRFSWALQDPERAGVCHWCNSNEISTFSHWPCEWIESDWIERFGDITFDQAIKQHKFSELYIFAKDYDIEVWQAAACRRFLSTLGSTPTFNKLPIIHHHHHHHQVIYCSEMSLFL